MEARVAATVSGEGKENVPTVVVVDKVKEVPELLCVKVGGDDLLIRELSPVSHHTQSQGLPMGEESTQMVSHGLLAIVDGCEDSSNGSRSQ